MQTNLVSGRGDTDLSTYLWAGMAAVACVAIAWFTAIHGDLVAALSGYSPIGMMHPASLLPNFVADFPNGEGEMLTSLIGRVYRALGHLPLPDRLLVGVMIFLEAASLVAGTALLARRLSPHLPVWTAIGGGVLLATGTIASCDLARWFHPFYGSVYSFAYAAGFVALWAALSRRMLVAGLMIGLAATIHPIIAFFIGLAMAVAVMVELPRYRLSEIVAGAGAAILVAIIWYFIAFRGAGITGGAVDNETYIDIVRLMSFHWFPVPLGVFGARAWETLLPFMALMIVFVASLRLGDGRVATTDRQMLAGVAVLAILALAGAWLTTVSANPLLIKLALHRASLIALLLAATLAVPRLLATLVSGPFLAAILAGFILLLTYWRTNGAPLSAAVLFALVTVVDRRERLSGFGRWLIVAMLAALALVAGLLASHGYFSALHIEFLQTITPIQSRRLLVAALVVVLVARLLRSPVVAAAAITCGLVAWLPLLDPVPTLAARAQAESYLAVQEWARDNTDPDAVFMVDPASSYGWRQYSHRPSFGVLREWLYSGWGYNTNPVVMAEGLKRAGLLGLDVKSYTDEARTDKDGAYARMVGDAIAAYYGMDAGTLSRFAADNGIAYFVFDKTRVTNLPDLSIAFENDRYVVLMPVTPRG